MAQLILAASFGLAIGLALGAVGGGGSILAVPLLVYALGFTAHQAAAASLVIVGASALAGGVGHARAGHVDVHTATVFAAAALPAAVAGAFVSTSVSDHLLLAGFGVLLLVAAWLMRHTISGGADESHRGGVTRTILIGAGTGVLTGFFGVGGGFLIVPALVIALSLPMAEAVGTSLVVIALSSGGALVIHLNATQIPWALTSFFAATAILGALLGTRLTAGASSERLSVIFAGLAVVVGVLLLVTNARAIA